MANPHSIFLFSSTNGSHPEKRTDIVITELEGRSDTDFVNFLEKQLRENEGLVISAEWYIKNVIESGSVYKIDQLCQRAIDDTLEEVDTYHEKVIHQEMKETSLIFEPGIV